MARNLIGSVTPTKAWPDMTDAEKDAFVDALYEQMKANREAADAAKPKDN